MCVILLGGAILSSLTGAFGLTRYVFDRWRTFENFKTDIDDICHILGMRTGLRFEIDPARLLTTHVIWARSCDEWLTNLLPETTTVLSHLKQAAILLDKFCENTPISVHEDASVRATAVDNPQDGAGSTELPDALPPREIQKFFDGGSHYLGWLLAYHVCEFFESGREDRLDEYVARITDEFELDMVSCLMSGKSSSHSLHMVLKALFLRD